MVNKAKLMRNFQLVLVLICCLGSGACLGGLGLSSTGEDLPPASDPLVADARDAWNSGNMQFAENLYGQATKLNLSPEEQSEVWSRFAIAASRNGRPNSALDALDQWDIIIPDADSSDLWQETWLSSVRLLSPSLAIIRAEKAWEDAGRSVGARAQAGIILMGRSWNSEQSLAALQVFEGFYAGSESQKRVKIENLTSEEVRYMTSSNLSSMGRSLAVNSEFNYPINIILLENVRRGFPVSEENMARLQDTSLYADASLPNRVLTATTAPTQAATGGEAPAYQGTCLVLALPGSGNIAPISYKIRTGADIAKAELAKDGVEVQVEFIDTTSPNWINQLQALPQQCAVVGGPLQARHFSEAKQLQLTYSRNFFTFLPVLEGQDEGRIAWRFFPSPQDQIDSLLAFTRELGIKSYGSFFPQDNYGMRMNTIFSEGVSRFGGSVNAVAYTPAEVGQWTVAAEELFKPEIANGVPLSTATFEAVFLPDSWRNMDMITSAFHYNGDDKQVLLGTSLWEQSLMNGGVTTKNIDNYKLAVFPGAWNPSVTPAGFGADGNDFWTGLGYDFVRLGAGLGIQAVAGANEVNSKLQSAQNIKWSMAPISYDSAGRASQRLFLFSIAKDGIKLADTGEMSRVRSQAISDFDIRKRTSTGVTNPSEQATPPAAQ